MLKKITCKYSVLHYEGMDEELTEKLSKYNTIDEGTGFEYQISTVDAVPGEKAREYVEKYGKQQLDAELKNNAKKLRQITVLIIEWQFKQRWQKVKFLRQRQSKRLKIIKNNV